MTPTRGRPSLTSHIATGRHGMTARIKAAGERLSDRSHAAADDRARALGWEITKIPVGSACAAAATATPGSP